jgi:hypothetical protein
LPFEESRVFNGHDRGDISLNIITQRRKYSSMFSQNSILNVNEQASVSVSRNWPQPPMLTISESNQIRIEELLFSPASPITSQIHRDRIEELLFSPASPISAQHHELFSSPTSPIKDPMPPKRPRYGFHIPQPFPRPFEELHTERCYLLDCLQTENRKATEFLRSITPLEERLIQNDETFYQRKKVKKRLGWLRRRLDETGRQEKRILARLGQVSYEIQARERWTQIQYERRQYESQKYFQKQLYGMHPMQLNPEMPVFQPQGYTPWPPGQWQQWQPHGGQESFGGWSASQSPSMYPWEHIAECSTNDQISPKDTSATTELPGVLEQFCRPPLTYRSSSLNDVCEPLEVLSTNTSSTPVLIVKRPSLPLLPHLLIPESANIWTLPRTEEKKSEVQDEIKERDQANSSDFKGGQ